MKLITILTFFCLQSVLAQSYILDTIQYVGHPENTYDVVILAEGYTQAEMQNFRTDAKKVKESFLTNDIYSSLLPKMNIFTISTVSEESGISLRVNFPLPTDPIQTPKIKNTIFGIYFQNTFRAYYLDDSTTFKAKSITSEYIPFSEVALILTNDNDRSSGRASYLGVAVATKFKSNDPVWSNFLVNHELIHSIAGLADEYSLDKEINFNKDITNDPTKIRWRDLLSLPGVGIDSLTTGVYIPNQNCIMANGNGTYTCPVCSRRMKEVIEKTSKKITDPHRIILENFDSAKKTISYTWDAIPGATGYEIVFGASWRSGLFVKTTANNSVTFELNDEDVKAIPGWRININIRAFNTTSTSSFISYKTSIYAKIKMAIPTTTLVEKLSATSYKLTLSSPDNTPKVNWIRLVNEEGTHSDILTLNNTVTLKNLVKDKKYFYRVAATLPEESTDYLPSPFSEIRPLNEVTNLAEFEDDKSFYTISPNPIASNQLNIQVAPNLENEQVHIAIFDVSGRLCRSFKVSQTNIILEVEELSVGEYFVSLRTKSNESILKFVKINN